jgi:hypothetical protein
MMCSTIASLTNIRLDYPEKNTTDKHPSLLRNSISDEDERFFNIITLTPAAAIGFAHLNVFKF